MADQPENRTVDKRVALRYLRKGIVDEKDYERYVKTLPDLAEQAMPVEASIEHDELDDEDGDAA
jgi:hypothetical protein